MLKHIWDEGMKAAEAEQRRFSDKDYFRQLDGLSFEEVVHFTDATYDVALKYNPASDDAIVFAPPVIGRESGTSSPRYRDPPSDGRFQRMPGYPEVPHGGTDLYGSGQR